MYIELHAASAFSFLEGASLPETLVDRAAALGYPAVALLDRDGVYGIPRFHLAAKAAGLRAIVGAEITVRTNGQTRPPTLWRLPLLVASQEGYRNLCRLVTRMKLAAPKGEGAIVLEDLEGHTAGLVALAGRAALDASAYGVGGLLDRLVGLFGRDGVYVELQRHLLRDEEADNQALRALAAAFRVPVVASNGVRFAAADERPLFDVLTCIRHKTTLARAGRRLAWNAERYLKAPDVMAQLFDDVPDAVRATRDLADRLTYTMADLGYRFPDYPVPAGETQASFLRRITEVGARDRYRPYHDRARAQIARELDLIEKLDLAGYFLIVWDIVNFCRQRGILVQGRGSAANSAVCYSLGITAVDPVGMELLFERFLSEERGEWPDIDLDLPSGDRREQAIQYVYQRYGQLGAAMTANVITYRGRSAAREVGKVLEIDAATVDRLATAISPFEWSDPEETLLRHLADAGLDANDQTIRTFAGLWRRIQDLPRHLGQHSGGMVVCQGRLDEVVPLEPAAMPGRVVIQWDKEDCADMGIVKVDLLGLGMMSALQDAITVINGRDPASDPDEGRVTAHQAPGARNGSGTGNREPGTPNGPGSRHQEPGTGTYLDLAHLPPDDPVVYRMLQEADTIGVFQVESRAQMATLPRLKPRTFYDIVVEVALIRPGPIVGQMVHPFIKRRNNREAVEYPHPSLEPILKRTLGVPLFQEQLLRMAMVAAGFTGGEAEELRRAMGFKRSEARMRQIETKLREGMARRGILGAAAEAIVRSITSFALYGFPESHAASFALIVYASAYLKAHYPAAFCAALLNNQPMGFYHPATLVKDAQRHGVRFLPIDVQASMWDCTVGEDGAVRLGLRHVSGLREEVGRRIESAPRCRPQPADDVAFLAADGAAPAGGGPANGGGPGVRDDTPLRAPAREPRRCPHCGADDPSMLERVGRQGHRERWFCNVCAQPWDDTDPSSAVGRPSSGWRDCSVTAREERGTRNGPGAKNEERRTDSASIRFRSVEHLLLVSGAHRDELVRLAEIGALNPFGYDRRSALWQVERAVRPAGELFEEGAMASAGPGRRMTAHQAPGTRNGPGTRHEAPGIGSVSSPLRPMSPIERVIADYENTGLTIGPHPMALRRAELALRGVLRAIDLPRGRAGRRVRVAGAVITRQRPGTAKGFVFLTLEDETGIANVIVEPDTFAAQRQVIVREPYVLVEGVLQLQDDVTSVKADRVHPLTTGGPPVESHDFR
jgi:error-prone DNA polymerase